MSIRGNNNMNKDSFLLAPDVVFLNHGSFGACPKPVFETYQHLQRELETQPVKFIDQKVPDLIYNSRKALAAFLNADPDDLVYYPNPTTALNMVIKSLDLKPGDQILTTDQEYGALERTWRFICNKTGAEYIHHPIPLPVTSHDDFVENFWSGVTEKTKIIFISQITAPTALIFPVEEICRRARKAGIFSMVDGAHAPGQIPVDLKKIDADIYTGACHKWLCAPKGAAFLYARREIQHLLEPLVVSWGWESDNPGGSRFIDNNQWQGTRDLSAYLSVPAAIDFHVENKWEIERSRCRILAKETRNRVNSITGLDSICPDDSGWFAQMVSIRLPDVDLGELKTRLYKEYKVEVPFKYWNKQSMVRVSFQVYNTQEDADIFVDALKKFLY